MKDINLSKIVIWKYISRFEGEILNGIGQPLYRPKVIDINQIVDGEVQPYYIALSVSFWIWLILRIVFNIILSSD